MTTPGTARDRCDEGLWLERLLHTVRMLWNSIGRRDGSSTGLNYKLLKNPPFLPLFFVLERHLLNVIAVKAVE